MAIFDLPNLITFGETVTFDNLSEAVAAHQQLAADRAAELAPKIYTPEAQRFHIIYTLMVRGYNTYAKIADIFQKRRDDLVAHLLIEYPNLPNDAFFGLTWFIGRQVILTTPIVIYYDESYHEELTEQGRGFVRAQWNITKIKGELNFKEYLKNIYGYDQYRQDLETDVIVQWVKDEFYLTPIINVYWTIEEDYDFIDFLHDVVKLILSPITTALEIIFYNKFTVLSSLILFTFVLLPALEAVSLTLAQEYALAGGEIVDVATGQYLTVTSFSAALSAEFRIFLETIHWSTLVSAHNIALIVSEEYREIWRDVQDEISKMSEALGLGPHYMNLIIRNTRNLVLDVSSALGMKYDLAQVQWLSTFSDYSAILSARAYRYRDDPSLIITDLEELVDRKLIDGKGGFMATVVGSIDATLVAVEGIANSIVDIKDDLDRLAKDMPTDMSTFVREYTDPIVETVDTFINNIYNPTMDDIQSILRVLGAAKTTLRTDLDGIIDRLKKPADYIGEIDGMSDDERLEQEAKLQDLTTRPLGGNVGDLTNLTDPASAELEKLRELIETPRPRPTWFTEELETPIRPAKVKAKPRKTWYVGEY